MAAKWICLDLETTGPNPKAAEIIEIGAYDGIQQYSWLIRPKGVLTPIIQQITHITPELLDQAAMPFAYAIDALTNLIAGRVIVGHNILKFDAPILRRQVADEIGKAAPLLSLLEDSNMRDTAGIYKGMALGRWPSQPHAIWAMKCLNTWAKGLKYNLADACASLGIPALPDAHRAGPDCEMTWRLCVKLAQLQQLPQPCRMCGFAGGSLNDGRLVCARCLR